VASCAALERHHTAEDAATFPAVATAHPEPAGVVATLTRDHELVAGMLRSMAAVVDRVAAGGDRTRTLQELDGLGALLESRFTYEERRLAAALSTLNAGPRE
jgi:hemerythrin-like domain-containing protein